MIFESIADASRKTFCYSGRSERLEHWAFLFFSAICMCAVIAVNRFMMPVTSFPINWIVLVIGLWIGSANISLMVRRLHDHNVTGFLLFFPLLSLTAWAFGSEIVIGLGVEHLFDNIAFWSERLGKIGFMASALILMGFFAREGDHGTNRYGFPG